MGSAPASTDDLDRAEILTTITSFLSALSSANPADALGYILPESYAVLLHHPPDPSDQDQGKDDDDDDDGLTTCTLADLVSRTASQHAAGSSTTTTLVSPDGPDVWIGGRFAAVWASLSVMDASGTELRRGVAAYTLFKREEGWRIGGLADKQWAVAGAADAPPATTVLPDEVVAPTLELCKLLNEERWGEVEALMLPGGGATYMRFPHTLIMVGWPDFFGKMRVMLEKAKPGYVEQALMDWDGRVCGDVGLVWTPFTVALDGEVRIRGYNIFTMLKRGGRWLISGAQDG